MVIHVFVYGTYILAILMFVVSLLYHRVYRPLNVLLLIADESVLLILLLLFFWFVESYAHSASPFFYYPDLNIDVMVPFASLPVAGGSGPFPPDIMSCVLLPKESAGIPLSVLLMETILSYCIFHITRLAGVRVLFRPFLAAVTLVALDLLLDPVLAKTMDCTPSLQYQGLGIWVWFHAPSPAMQAWFGVLLFNFAAWLSAPLIAVGVMLWLSYPLAILFSPSPPPPPRFPGGLLLLLIVFVIVWVPLLSPSHNFVPELQWTILLVPVLVALAMGIVGLVLRQPVAEGYNLAWLLGMAAYGIFTFGLLLVGYFGVLPIAMAIACLLFMLVFIVIVLPYVLP